MQSIKLTTEEIEEFYNSHLPYKITQLKTHHFYKREIKNILKGSPLAKKYSICAIEISFIAGRLFLDFLGIGLDSKKNLIEKRKGKKDDINVTDLGGKWAELATLTKKEKEILEIFYHRGNKGAAHFTWDKIDIDGWQYLDDGVEIVVKLLNENLYSVVGREMKEQ